MDESRRNYMINRQFQVKYIRILIVFNAMAALIIAGVLALILKSQAVSAVAAGSIPVDHLNNLILPITGGISLVYIITSSAAIWVIMVRFTNRDAGPVYRITETLKAMSEGDIMPPPSLRDGDEFFETFAALRSLQERLTWNINDMRKAIEVLEGASLSDDEKTTLEDLKRIVSDYTIPPMD